VHSRTEEPLAREPEQRSRLAPGIVRLGWISFLLDVASEMVYPLIPIFVGTLLAAPGLALGAIEGAAEGLLSVVTALSGWHSDRMRRRVPYIRLGYALAAVAKPLLALAYAWPAVLALRSLDRLGKGLRTAARDALIGDLAGARRGAAFGFHRAMDTAGALTGVLLALLLLSLLPGEYRTIFALTAVPGAAAVVLTLTIREAPRVSSPPTSEGGGAGIGRLPRAFWSAASLLWLFALGNSSDAFLLLRASELGFSDLGVVWAYAAYNLVYSCASYPAGRASDRFGRRRVLAIGWTLYALTYAGFALAGGAALWWLFPLYGLHMGLTQGVARAWIVDGAPSDARGTALGVYHLGLGAALFSSSLFAGWLWDTFGARSSFAFGSAVAVLALLALLATGRDSSR